MDEMLDKYFDLQNQTLSLIRNSILKKEDKEDYKYSPSAVFTKKYLPSPQEGCVVGNVDNSIYNYKNGNFMSIEYKSSKFKIIKGFLKYGQWDIYRMLDEAWSQYLPSELNKKFNFKGTYVIWSNKYELDKATRFAINGMEVTKEELIEFMSFKKDFQSYDFKKGFTKYDD